MLCNNKKNESILVYSRQSTASKLQDCTTLGEEKKPHTEAETVIMPALIIAVDSVLNHESVEKIKKIPLSAHTMSRRIEDMSADLDDQIREFVSAADEIEKLWGLQIDESTDISGKAQLLAYIRFVKDGRIQNFYFFCDELKETTTGNDIFDLVNQNVTSRGMKWQDCVSVCTDGAPSMQGRKKGFVAYVRILNPSVKIVHCMIHREVLVSKSLPDSLAVTMNEVIKIVNYIKANPLRSRIFASLCDAMDSDYNCLLFHTDVRWLSKGKVLARVVFLRTEIISFLETEDVQYEFIHDNKWWLNVTFLSDLFDKLNNLNLSLQGAKENIITISCKLKAFNEKLDFWMKKVNNNQLEIFPGVDAFPIKNQILGEIIKTLENLQASFVKYFPSLETKQYEWVLNPFGVYDDASLTLIEQENLIDLKNDIVHKNSFAEKELSAFWMSLRNEYPQLTKSAIRSLLPFGSSYLCEFGFSALTEIKSKRRERLQMIDQEMRVCLSDIEPRLELICSKKHAQVSH